MITYTGKDLARSFRDVRGNTITIAEEIPAEKYTFQAAPGVQGYLNLKGYYEFDARDRPEGWNVWATLAFSPAAPEPKPVSTPRPQWK